MLSIASGTQAAHESNLDHIAIGDVIDAVDGVALRGLSQGVGHRRLHCATTIVQQTFCLFASALRADIVLCFAQNASRCCSPVQTAHSCICDFGENSASEQTVPMHLLTHVSIQTSVMVAIVTFHGKFQRRSMARICMPPRRAGYHS